MSDEDYQALLDLVGWDQTAADREAWENLKARFYASCPDQENWIVDEEHRGLYNTKTGQGVNSAAFINWAEIKRQAAAMK